MNNVYSFYRETSYPVTVPWLLKLILLKAVKWHVLSILRIRHVFTFRAKSHWGLPQIVDTVRHVPMRCAWCGKHRSREPFTFSPCLLKRSGDWGQPWCTPWIWAPSMLLMVGNLECGSQFWVVRKRSEFYDKVQLTNIIEEISQKIFPNLFPFFFQKCLKDSISRTVKVQYNLWISCLLRQTSSML